MAPTPEAIAKATQGLGGLTGPKPLTADAGFIDVEPPPIPETAPTDDGSAAGAGAEGEDSYWWNDPAYSGWVTDGKLTSLPLDPSSQEWKDWAAASGITGDKKAGVAIGNLVQHLAKAADAWGVNEAAYKNNYEKAKKNLQNLLKTEWAKENGITEGDLEALLASALQGGAGYGSPDTGGGGGAEPPIGQPPGGGGGGGGGVTVPIGPGGGGGGGSRTGPPTPQLTDEFGNLNNQVVPEWLKTGDPAVKKAWLDWLAYQQSRADRQTAIDTYGDYGKFLQNDPTRQAMYDYLGEGPQLTYDPETIERMKTEARTQAGYGLTQLDEKLRAAAAQAGIPTSTLSALAASGRTDILNSLLGGERQVDILAAQQKTADMERYFGNLNAAQGSLVGPMGSYYGGLAGLISGAPGLAQTGNPLAGLAEYRAYQDYINQRPTGADRLGGYAGMAGNVLGGGGSFLSGIGSL